MAMRPHSLASAVLVVTLFALGSATGNGATVPLGKTGHTLSPPGDWEANPSVEGDVVYRCTAPKGGGFLEVYTGTEQQSLVSLSIAHERRMDMARKGWIQKAEKEIDLRGAPSLYRIYAATEGTKGHLVQALYYTKGARTFVVQAIIDASKYGELFKPAQQALLSLREGTPPPEPAAKPEEKPATQPEPAARPEEKPATRPEPAAKPEEKPATDAAEQVVRTGRRSLAPGTATGAPTLPPRKPAPETTPPDTPAPPKQEPAPTELAPKTPSPAFRPFTDPAARLGFEVPTHWTSQKRGTSTIFSGPRKSEEFRTTITLQIMAPPTPAGDQSSLDACASQLLRQVQTSPSGQVGSDDTVTLAGLTARRIRASFAIDGQAFCMDQLVVVRPPHACWLGFTAPKELFEEYHRHFERAVSTLSLAEAP